MNFKLFHPKYKTYSDEDLMRLMIEGANKLAFEELYHRYAKKLVWLSMRIIGNKEPAEDIIQDVFIKLIDSPERYDVNQKFSTWIYTLVKNASLSQLKNETNREKLMKENYIQTEISYLSTNIDSHIIRNKLNQLFQDLNQKEQLVFSLRFEQELSIKEIAQIAEIPEGSVKSCIYYLLKKMAPHLKIYQ